jgi:putative transposase
MARNAQPIKLSDNELRSLTTLLRRGSTAARAQTRARVLDLLHRGQHPNHIAETLGISSATVFNIKRRYQQEGLESALFEKPRPASRRPLVALSEPRSLL